MAGDLRVEDFDVWQDAEVRFDAPSSQLQLRRGEHSIDTLGSVEDTKGNNGERGQLTVTNLRLLWVSHRSSRVNMSVGWGCLAAGKAGIAIKTAQSRLRGTTQALFLSSTFQGAKFEFIFTSLTKANPRVFATAVAVYRAYETSRAYRELKLRGAIIRPEDKSVVLLPRERVFSRLDGIWNLASDTGNLGVAVVTSQRFVWRALMAENFNVSVPYTCMQSVSVRESKFGRTLVLAISERAGGYLFGFRVDPPEKLDTLAKELQALRTVAYTSPDFGVVHSVEGEAAGGEAAGAGAKSGASVVSEDVEVVGEGKEGEGDGVGAAGDAYAAYLAEGPKEGDRPVVFSPELGLAIEAPPPGLTVAQLWAAL